MTSVRVHDSSVKSCRQNGSKVEPMETQRATAPKRSRTPSASLTWMERTASQFGSCSVWCGTTFANMEFYDLLDMTIILCHYLRQRRRYMFLSVLVCLSVCLYVNKITKNACIDFNEMLRVDRCRDMDELINFCVRSGS